MQSFDKTKFVLNSSFKQLNWLLGRNSQLNVENKLLIYKTIIIPIWTTDWNFGDALANPTSQSSKEVNQKFSEIQ
jgi:hypothetical protein